MHPHIGFMPANELPPDLKALEKFSTVMDRAIRIPGTRVELGLDALVGLVPAVGDVVTAVMSYGVIIAGLRHRVPTAVLVQMVVNTLVDMGVGSVPLVGDILDVFYKSNAKNVELLLANRDLTQAPRDVPAAVKGVVGVAAAVSVSLVFSVGAGSYDKVSVLLNLVS